MPPSQSEWERILNPTGPIRVEHEDGTLVTEGDRGFLRSVGGEDKVEDASEIEIALQDATGKPGRVIPGETVVGIGEPAPVIVITVDDDLEPDPGDTVVSRGNRPPTQSG